MDVSILGGQNGLPTNRETSPPAAPSTVSSPAHDAKSANGTGQAGYVSPVVKIDGATGRAVLEFRDQGTGDQAFQVPSETALKYDQQQLAEENAPRHSSQTTA